jgi:hypothetical protein
VLIDVSVNTQHPCQQRTCRAAAAMHQVASYESLYRRVIRRAPSAALMSVAMFSFSTYSMSTAGNTTAQVLQPNPFHNSGEALNQ